MKCLRLIHTITLICFTQIQYYTLPIEDQVNICFEKVSYATVSDLLHCKILNV